MILAIDIGNTNIVVGCIDEEKTYFIERVSTDRSKTELEYAIVIKNVLDISRYPRRNSRWYCVFCGTADHAYRKISSGKNSGKRCDGARTGDQDRYEYPDGQPSTGGK